MPISFPAHQAVALPLVRVRPGRFDGVALFVGSAMPDLAYVLGQWMNRHSHDLIGLVVWGIPATMVTAWLIRWRVADGVLRQLPDTSLRFRSWAAVSSRRPAVHVTAVSALLGVGSHQFIDGFTHTGRWGANLFGWNDVLFTVPLRGAFTWASVMQYLGHTVGSAITIALVASMSRRRWPDERYGVDVVAAKRAELASVTRLERGLFWLALFGILVPVWGAALVLGRSIVFWTVTMSWFALLVAGGLRVPRRWSGRWEPPTGVVR